MKKIVFFDFDGTLIKRDSFFIFAKYKFGKLKVFKILLKNIFPILLALTHIEDRSKIKQQLFLQLYHGISYEEFCESGLGFSNLINKIVNKEILKKAIDFQKKDFETVIVSASIKDWITPWAMKNGFNRVIATEVEINKKGLLTGYFSTPNCKGKEKVSRILAAYPNLHDYESWAYGNSKDDFGMFGIVNHSYKI